MADSTQEVVAKRPKTKAGTSAASSDKTSAASTGKAAPTKTVATSAPQTAAPARPSFLSRLTGRSAETPSPELKTATGATQTVTSGNKTQAASAGATEAATQPRPSFLSLLTGRGAPAGKGGQPGMGRFFFGMSLYMVLALGAQVGLGYLFQVVPGHGAQVLISLPIIGNVTLALFTWMVVLIGILFLLYKFNILPRSLGSQQRQKLASVKADPKATRAAPAKPVREPLSGPNDEAYDRVKARIRAERRKERRH